MSIYDILHRALANSVAVGGTDPAAAKIASLWLDVMEATSNAG